MPRKPALQLPPETERAWRLAEQRDEPGYRDPGLGLFVMTEAALRARGRCCGSACRHCPFDWADVSEGR